MVQAVPQYYIHQQQPAVAYCVQPTPVYYSHNRMSAVNPQSVPVAQYSPQRSFWDCPDCCCFGG
ncbi:hypothetical protein CLU79DRAFT_762543 [Phycomyces nitens]|nr:hypothetical protein CLU79DRAFT_762543 [Phycomyces nitens]